MRFGRQAEFLGRMIPLAAALIVAGCHSDPPQAQDPEAGGLPPVDALPFRVDSGQVLASGPHSSATAAGQRVLASAAAFDSFWVEVAPGGPQPSAGFRDSLLLAVTLGERPTSGYGIRIDSLTRTGDTILVHGTNSERLTNCPLLQVVTSPFQVIQVPRLEGTFVFAFTSESTACPP